MLSLTRGSRSISPPLKKQQIFTDIPSMITERQERAQLSEERSLREAFHVHVKLKY